MRKLSNNQSGRVSKGILSLVLAISMLLAVLTPVRALADDTQPAEVPVQEAAAETAVPVEATPIQVEMQVQEAPTEPVHADAGDSQNAAANDNGQTVTAPEVSTPGGDVDAARKAPLNAGVIIGILALIGASVMAGGVAVSKKERAER
ncbi:MAG: hypothetical protein U0L49_11605 [Eubacterium sp.]|nr:hypothetical protein [Eubacterium sp.]